MKYLLLLFTAFASVSAFGITTKNCPETMKLNLSQFRQEREPRHSEDNPGLPFAYINIQNLSNASVILNKISAANAACEYRTEDGAFRSRLEGSLNEGASKKAILKTYFEDDYQGMRLGYVLYSPVKGLTKDKVLVLKGRSYLYYRGEQCSWGDCISDYFELGSAYAMISFAPGGSCVSVEEATALLVDHLDTKTNYREKTIDRLVKSLRFVSEEQAQEWNPEVGYYTDVAQSWQCAAGAECWFGFFVNCAGEVDKWHGGED